MRAVGHIRIIAGTTLMKMPNSRSSKRAKPIVQQTDSPDTLDYRRMALAVDGLYQVAIGY